ncbi:MAG: N-acetyltransferase [Myxococcota bacterium]
MSGHLDLTVAELELHYVPALDRALRAGCRFVVGDARGADALAQTWLAGHGAAFEVFHMLASPRHHSGDAPLRGGFGSDTARDAAMTAASDFDIAWVRPGRERSGTARNLERRTSTGAPRVERATPDDWRRTRSLRLTALLQYPDAFSSTHAHEAVQPGSFWMERLRAPGVTTLIGTLDRRDVGITVVAPLRKPRSDGAIYGVWVSPLARGRGVGDALIRAALDTAADAGLQGLRLEVGERNGPAIGLYERHGFQRTGRSSTMPPPREHLVEIELRRVL